MARHRSEALKPGKPHGRHYEKRLKAAFVKRAPPGRHTDGGGLYLEVKPSGSRHWLLRLTIKGRRRDLGLGSVSTVSLAEARERAGEYRRIARSGGDPTRRKDGITRRTVSFAQASDEVHRTHIIPTSKNGKHVNQWLNTLRIYTFPYIGNAGVDDITRADIIEVLSPIWLKKPETARRVLQRMKTVFDWCVVKGYRKEGNPVESVRMALPKQKQKVKHFTAIEWEETPRLMRQLERTEGIGAIALRFTILTALRSGPVRHATWDQFSEGFQFWTIPAENMKADREFAVPLPTPAIDILKGLSNQSMREGSPYVFSAPRNSDKPLSENTMPKVLKRYHPNATVHGMRSAFRDWAEIFAEARREVKEFALAHINDDKVESAYLRTQYFHEREQLMEVWGRWICGAEGTYAEILNQVLIEQYDTD